MGEKNKQLLITDICARIPYGVVCGTPVGDFRLLGIDGNVAHLDSPVYDEGDGYFDVDCEEVKPYLRRMSSMTEGEKRDYQYITERWMYDAEHTISESIDWLNERHFDHRGLIGMGLALEAPEGMYETKTE